MPREIPQYVQQLSIGAMPTVTPSMAQAELTQKASAEMSAISLDMTEKSNRITQLNTRADIMENLQRIEHEAGADPALARAKIDSYTKGLLKNSADPELGAFIKLHSLPIIDAATRKANSNLDDNLTLSSIQAHSVNMQSLSSIASQINSPDPESQKAAIGAIGDIMENSKQIAHTTKSDGTYLFTPKQMLEIGGDSAEAIVNGLPLEKQLDVLGMKPGGFDAIIPTIHKNEGGYAPIDGNTGKAVIFGITEKWHPEAFAKTMEIYQTQGEDAARAYSDQYYKKIYWDKYNLDALSANQQGIVMDGLVNHRPEFAEKLVAAAKEGATPSELITMRQEEYDRLAKSGKYSKQSILSWSRRLSEFNHLLISDYVASADIGTQDRLRQGAIKAVEGRMREWRDDPFVASIKEGASSVDQSVAMQTQRGIEPTRARVMGNDEAKQAAQSLSNIDNMDNFIESANAFLGKYKGYESNAIRQLADNKLPPELNQAMDLSARDPNRYKDHISAFYAASRSDEGELNKALNARGEDPAGVYNEVVNKMDDDIYSIMQFEYSPSQVGANRTALEQVYTKAAKAYMIAKPGTSIEDAVDFITQPETEQYNIGKLGGFMGLFGSAYKIPVDIDQNTLERKMGDYYEKNVKPLGIDAIPVLNSDNKSYRFIDIIGNPVMKNGKPIIATIDDILPQDKTISLEQMMYGKGLQKMIKR